MTVPQREESRVPEREVACWTVQESCRLHPDWHWMTQLRTQISVIRQQSQSSVGLTCANAKVIEGWIRAKKCYYVGVKLSPDRGMNQWS